MDVPGVEVHAVISRSVLMNVNGVFPSGAPRHRAASWSLTQADILLCALPIALFLSIVSLV